MKAALFLCAVSALALRPPRIELDMAQVTKALHQDAYVNHAPDTVNAAAGDYTDHADGRTADSRDAHRLQFTANAAKLPDPLPKLAERASTVNVHVIKLGEPIWREHNVATYTQAPLPATPDHAVAVAAGKAAASPAHPVRSRQDYTIRCAVCTAADCSNYHETCQLPMAKAYDHFDQSVDVVKTLYRVDYQKNCTNFGTFDDASTVPADCDLGDFKAGSSTTQESGPLPSIDWTQRATYLMKYDAEDDTGNKAEQAVVALIIDDLNPPEISSCLGTYGQETVVEAGSGWSLCSDGTSAYDQIDKDVTERVRLEVWECTGNDSTGNACNKQCTTCAADGWTKTPWTTNCEADSYFDAARGCRLGTWTIRSGHTEPAGDGANGFHEPFTWADPLVDGAAEHGSADHDDALTTEPISDRQVGLYKVTYFARDKAGIYGNSYEDNWQTKDWYVRVEDDAIPVIKLEQSDQITAECGENTDSAVGQVHSYTDPGAMVYDRLDNLNHGFTLDYNASVSPCTPNSRPNTQKDACTCNSYASCYPTTGNKWEPLDLRPVGGPITYTISFDAWDQAGKQAVTKHRQVVLVDTVAPTITLNSLDHAVQTGLGGNYSDHTNVQRNIHGTTGEIHYRVGFASAGNFTAGDVTAEWDNLFDPGATCHDACDRSVTDSTITMSWNIPFDDNVEGRYTRTYSCCDSTSSPQLCSTVERVFVVDDLQAPRITVVDPEPENNIFEAQHNVDYADPGATCWDYVDNELDDQVVASGDLVKMAVPGIYQIFYDCQDLSGNPADQESRLVKVIDSTCPQIKVNGALINYLESGFPFQDELPSGFATAYDTLDGDLTHDVVTNGDSVTTASTFYMKDSCQAIKEYYAAAKTSEYYVSRQIRGGHFERVLVWCNFNIAGDTTFDRTTYFFVRNGKTVPASTNLYSGSSANNAASECPDHGLKLLQVSNADESQEWYTDLKAQFPSAFPSDLTGSRSDYICVDTNFGCSDDSSCETAPDATHSQSHAQWRAAQAQGAQIGKYVIEYMVTDAHGNSNNCDNQDCDRATIYAGLSANEKHFWDASGADLKWCSTAGKRLCNNNYAATTADAAGPHAAMHQLDCNSDNAKRTVIVKDDLPPVLSLSQHGDPHDPENRGQWTQGSLTSTYMTEQQASANNAWFFGAAAAAAAGVAMLGLSRRKQIAVVSVPV